MLHQPVRRTGAAAGGPAAADVAAGSAGAGEAAFEGGGKGGCAAGQAAVGDAGVSAEDVAAAGGDSDAGELGGVLGGVYFLGGADVCAAGGWGECVFVLVGVRAADDVVAAAGGVFGRGSESGVIGEVCVSGMDGLPRELERGCWC